MRKNRKGLLPYCSGGSVSEKLEPLMEMFRVNEKALVYAEKFTNYFEGLRL